MYIFNLLGGDWHIPLILGFVPWEEVFWLIYVQEKRYLGKRDRERLDPTIHVQFP